MIPAAALAPRHAVRDPRPDPGPRLEGEYRPRGPLDLFATVAGLQRGPGDPTQTVDGPVIWRATRTPEGLATLALRQSADGSVRLAAWGPGREWAIAQAPALCGADDDPASFEPRLGWIAEAHRRHPGLRMARTDLLFDALAQSITEQKVTLRQAFGAWRRIVTWCGERAPGPTPWPMFAPPSAEGWRRVPSWAWHRAGLEPPQARTIVEAAARASSLQRAADLDTALASLRGIGPWTIAETRIRALGDPDAVSVGDFHLAHHVGYALTGARTDDAGMLELLEPWRGHRQRVIRLIYAAGRVEPRRGARLHIEDHRER
ncbi:DNA-3-methyladenine glycosylase family protein [Microbacterium sediminis]|uniref:DNA-3-methyladenine glycosylase family protein n=1 Tax=Microbacterium sediminis TaxID=904291 RepID=UPI000A060077|nr:3-methyladenine DNA glycosylase [Microbacterium sediminis]QBR73393.1 DNA-3-methyladenine glycosylase 2 family protein [Microbacterium sediminis]